MSRLSTELPSGTPSGETQVLLAGELPGGCGSGGALAALLRRWGLRLAPVGEGKPIPGTFWGEPEAGIVGTTVHVRSDTPVHSVLHESCHVICADEGRRPHLHTDAGGDQDEENAVCYLQILLAAELPGFGRERATADMDAWGYSFRLGSARAWFEEDSADEREWLRARGLIDAEGRPVPPSPAAAAGTGTAREERRDDR